jgi:hypothetical protein
MTGTKVGELAGSRLGEIGGAGFKDENAWGALFQTARWLSQIPDRLPCRLTILTFFIPKIFLRTRE